MLKKKLFGIVLVISLVLCLIISPVPVVADDGETGPESDPTILSNAKLDLPEKGNPKLDSTLNGIAFKKLSNPANPEMYSMYSENGGESIRVVIDCEPDQTNTVNTLQVTII
jgi:hypothetical protein